jgi:hypothetical protein
MSEAKDEDIKKYYEAMDVSMDAVLVLADRYAEYAASLQKEAQGKRKEVLILMENTLRNYEEWEKVRQPEKQGFNDMRQCISDWCDRNGYDKNI